MAWGRVTDRVGKRGTDKGQPGSGRAGRSGQADDIVKLRRRRIAEEEAAAIKTNRPTWNSSPFREVPPALRGCKPITPEPWARDALVYEEGMNGHGKRR